MPVSAWVKKAKVLTFTVSPIVGQRETRQLFMKKE